MGGKVISRKVTRVPDQNGDGKPDRLVTERTTDGGTCKVWKGCEETENSCTCTSVEYRQEDGRYDYREPAYRGKKVTFEGKEYIAQQGENDIWKDGKNLRNARLILKPVGNFSYARFITKSAFEKSKAEENLKPGSVRTLSTKGPKDK